MVDVSSSWVCQTDGLTLSDVLKIHNQNQDQNQNQDCNQNHGHNGCPAAVVLCRPEESAPCVLWLNCRPPSAISGLELITEARTMEVYDESGEYSGTVRGEREGGDSKESFYRKRLQLERPSSSCQIKLLSLAGLRCVRVLSLSVTVHTVRSGASVNPGVIDLQQVQSLMDQMGTSLSPGAQNLLDLVHVQQQNQSSALSSLFPMLMGGVMSQTQRRPLQLTSSSSEASLNHNGAMSHDSSDSSCSEESSDSRSPLSPAHMTEMMMSHLARGRGQGSADSAPELLPFLQSVCGHVTQLRLDDREREKEREMSSEMDRRLEQMEQRLKEHLDKRLDALELKLDRVLKLVLDQVLTNPERLNGAKTDGTKTTRIKTNE